MSADYTCCFCGEGIPAGEELNLLVTKDGVATPQFLWAHPQHLLEAIRPAGIDFLTDEFVTGSPTKPE